MTRFASGLGAMGVLPIVVLGTSCSNVRDKTILRPVEGVSYSVKEVAHDGSHWLKTVNNGKNVIDANSDVIVSFKVEEVTAADATPEWQAINAYLQSWADQEKQRQAVDLAEVDLTDPVALKAIEKRMAATVSNAVQLDDQLEALIKALGIAGVDIDKIDFNTYPGFVPGDDPQQARARFLRQQLERLTAEAAARAEKTEKVRVTVQAGVSPGRGDARALHVKNYDTLPAGERKPIDRYGLKMTAAEEKQLRMEIDQATKAKDSIKEIVENRDRIETFLRGEFEQLKVRLKEAAEKIKTEIKTGIETKLVVGSDSWKSVAMTLIARLEELEQLKELEGKEEVKRAIAELKKALDGTVTSIDTLAAQVGAVELLIKQLEKADGADLVGVVTALSGATAKIRTAVVDVVDSWQANLAALKTAKEKLSAAISDGLTEELKERLETLLAGIVSPDDLAEFRKELNAQLPATAGFVATFLERVKDSKNRKSVEQILEDNKATTIPRPLSDLPVGIIDLTTASLVLGDEITTRVRFLETEENVPIDRARTLHEENFKSTTKLTGFHRTISGELIFARAETGTADAKSWKPNVAAVANWQYYLRDPTPAGEFWNGLGLGVGGHVAGLDQGDDSVELGLGFNVSMFNGFVTAGYGWNLSVDRNREYYFVGLDLIKTFNELASRAN